MKTNNTPKSDSIVGIGIIGCGHRIRVVLENTIKHSKQLQVRGLCDPNPLAIEKFQQDPTFASAKVYDIHEAMCQAKNIQWIMIGSWNAYHAQHAITAMQAGKHVFCEKPIATTMEDCLTMFQTLQQTRQIFSFGLVLRYAWLYRRIRQLLDEGQIGKLISLEFNETLEFNHGGYIHQDWRCKTQFAGTHLLEKCCHDIDIVNWLVGSPANRVASFGGLNFFTSPNAHHSQRIGPDPDTGRNAFEQWPRTQRSPFHDDKDIIDNQVAIIEYRNGVRATFHTNCMSGIPERRMLLLGSEGAIRADLLTGSIELKRIGWNTPSQVYKGVGGGHGGADSIMGEHLANTMLNDATPAVTLNDGLHAAITCFGIDQAMNEGKVVNMQTWWDQLNTLSA